MGHVNHRRLQLVMQIADLEPHVATQGSIEIGQRLVEEKRLGLAHDGATDCNALALTAGQLSRPPIEIVGEIEDMRRVLDLLVDRSLVLAIHLQRKGDVAVDAHMRIERIGLEYHRQAAFGRRLVGHVLAIDDDAAAAQVLKTSDHAQQGRLSAAGRADEDNELAIIDFKVDFRE